MFCVLESMIYEVLAVFACVSSFFVLSSFCVLFFVSATHASSGWVFGGVYPCVYSVVEFTTPPRFVLYSFFSAAHPLNAGSKGRSQKRICRTIYIHTCLFVMLVNLVLAVRAN